MKRTLDTERIIMAGSGGQGIIVAGKVLAQVAMLTGRHITFMPSYGAEVRGGTSNCTVIHSDQPIASPVADHLDTLLVMNQASLERFCSRLEKTGLVLYNEALVTDLSTLPATIQQVAIPCDALALSCGIPKIANMVMVGAFMCCQPHLDVDQLPAALEAVLPARHHQLIPTNLKALQSGRKFMESTFSSIKG